MASSTLKSRKTRVSRQPFWVPTDNGGKGGWRFLPVDLAHTARVQHFDRETGQRVGEQGTYEAKGWTPAYSVPADDPRRRLLPTNWKAIARGDAKTAEWSEEQAKRAGKAPADAAA